MQRVLGFSPLQAGLAFLPQTVLIAAGAQITARLVPRFGPRPLIVLGSIVAGVGLGWMTQVTPTSTFLGGLFGPYVLIGLGMGLAVTPIAVAGTAGIPRADAGLASGLLNTSRTIGASIGLAVLATLAATRTTHVLTRTVPTAAHTATALTDGYTLAFTVATIVLFVTAVVGQATLPSLQRMSQGSEVAPSPAPRPELDEAFETP
jgi:MFS family permease